jgi:hypothetical protein
VKKLSFFFLACIVFSRTYGQSELTFQHMENVLQSSYINPAHVPEQKVSIGLPLISSLHFSATNTGFSFNDLVDHGPGRNPYMNFDRMLNKLKKENYLYSAASADLFSIRVKVRHFYWSFNITEKLTARLSYPKDLITLVAKGNEPFIGGEVNLKDMGLDITHQREYGLGVVKQWSKIIVGVRVKYIQGLANVDFKPKDLGLVTDANYYGLRATTDASLNTAGIPDNVNKIDGSFARNYLTNMRNKGAGIDLGITYKLSRKIVLSAAINNVGLINWRSDANNYNIKGGSEFQGADLGKELLGHVNDTTDFGSKEGNKYLDSLKNSFNYSKTHHSYNTFLIPQIYLTAKYLLGPRTQAIGSVFLEKYIALRPAFTVGLYQELGRTINAIVTYSAQYGKFDNIGLGMVVKPPALPIQLYFAADNILNTYTIINNSYAAPLNARNFNLRFGINLVFGSVKAQDKQSYPEK